MDLHSAIHSEKLTSLLVIVTILKDEIERKKLMKKKKKKYESTRLTRQIRLTHQTWDPCHEGVITK
jgi:hypothetical protein